MQNRIGPLQHYNHEFEEDEVCCDQPDLLILGEGHKVCKNCGLILGQEMVSHERRAFNAEEIKDRKRTELRWRNFGPRTMITMIRKDAKGRQISPEKRALFARLSKIQGSLINGKERNYLEARPKLKSISNKLNLPYFVEETAWKVYCEVVRQRLTVGRTIEGFLSAAIYASIRIHQHPGLLEEIAMIVMIPVKVIHRSLAIIVHNVLPLLNLKYRPINPEPVVFHYGNALNLSIRVQLSAVNLLNNAVKAGLKSMGKDPKGLAAAVLYIKAKEFDEFRTQAQIAGTTQITEVTLRNRIKQIMILLKSKKK